MAATTTITVPHLGGITAGYTLSTSHYDPSKPTCILINSMCTTSALFKPQFADTALTRTLNLLAIEPLGHGSTSCPSDHFTYWDSAIMALQVMDHLKIPQAYCLGTSQGGWIVARMALLAPERVKGLVLLGTSMDGESVESRENGCWNAEGMLAEFYEKWCAEGETPDFVVDDVWCGMVGSLGFGKAAGEEMVEYWTGVLKSVYKGDEGRRKLRMALGCLLDRDGLLRRVRDITCPVYWMQGTDDVPFGLRTAAQHIKLFTGCKDRTLTAVEGGGHYLNATNPKEVSATILEMVHNYRYI
ncbi:hypothetical protein N0V88_003835 [Collariella sp. IMI 366227]|nr:hypothetical protein N0V88_003835 [Collariella sp. IMI 366227]